MSENKIVELYQSGKSMNEVAKKLKCSPHKVAYWLRKLKIPRRNRSDANYLKYNPDGDPFKIKHNLSKRETFLYGLGLGIYWGEGSKTTKHSLRVSNTDAGIIKTFRRFLLEICGVRKSKITYSIICFNDVEPNDVRKYWAKELGILPAKFGKITVIPKQGKGTYKKKSENGVCIIQISNIKLRGWMMDKLSGIEA